MVAEIVAAALPMVWRYARGMTADPVVAREVVLEVFRLVDARDPSADPPTVGQLLARARLACGDESRFTGPTVQRGRRIAEETRASTVGHADASPAGLREQLQDELTAMTPDAREALLLLDVLGLEAGRAADVCEVETATLHARRYRAHGRLVMRVVGDEL
jgi:DNA-directed RNA polymerase specialized sigma24 family protein